ncbi:MAG: ABC transporter permease [Candidatus Lokiarchaeota archaeon]|nr:ABC transporter permease [Candidatus Lokiarchaeota archaeon]
MVYISLEEIISKNTKIKTYSSQLRRSFIITKKDLRIYYNKPPVLIQGIIFPIILFIAITIGRNIPSNYLFSGLITMVLFLTSTSIGPIIFPWESLRKTFERMITCPISLKAILLGNLWSGFIYGMIFSSIPLIIGIFSLLIFNGFNIFFIILTMMVAAITFGALSLILSSPPTTNPGDTMVMTILIKFPLIFISPLFTPIDINSIALISPLTYLVDLINIGLGEFSAFGTFGILIDFSILIIFGFVLLILAFALHQRTLQKRFTG